MCTTCDDGMIYCFFRCVCVCVCVLLWDFPGRQVKYDVSCLATSWIVILCRFSHGVHEWGMLSSAWTALCWRVGGRAISGASRQVKPLTWCHSNDLINYKYSIWWNYKLLFDDRLLLKYFRGAGEPVLPPCSKQRSKSALVEDKAWQSALCRM